MITPEYIRVPHLNSESKYVYVIFGMPPLAIPIAYHLNQLHATDGTVSL